MGAKANKRALIDALVRLLELRGLASISVRDIAAEAGVNHGLVHRHFGSKAGLVRAAARAISDELHAADPVSQGVSASSFAYLRSRPALAQVVARACLDGPPEIVEQAAPDPERLADIVRPIRAALASLGLADAIDAHVLNAAASCLLLGWFTFRPLLNDGFGLPDDADDQLHELLARLDDLMARFRGDAP